MKKWMIPMLTVTLMTAACSSDEKVATPLEGEGKVVFTCSTEGFVADVTSRATEGYQLPAELIPSGEEMQLTLSGNYTEKDENGNTSEKSYGPRTWATVADYNTEAPALEAGIYDAVTAHNYLNSYSAAISYGNPDEEGAAKPCFTGGADAFTIAANKTTPVLLTARLSNSCFVVEVTEWMLNYYTGIELTIHTASNSFTFNPTTTAPSELIFVKPGQQLALSGKAVKAQNGVEVEFPKTTIGTGAIVAESCYTISVDHTTAGSGNLQIAFDESFTEVPAVDVDLNADGK